MTGRPYLNALAERAGIEPAYTDVDGVRHVCSDDTKVTLLEAMGYPAASEAQARETLEERACEEDEAVLPPVRVIPAAEFPRSGLAVRVPLNWTGEIAWRAELATEQGERLVQEGRVAADERPTLRVEWGESAPMGYHEARVWLRGAGKEREAATRLILTPGTCVKVEEALGGRRVFGLCANLYTVRSARNWGVGDFGDLAELVRWMGRAGGAFVGVNPLHALFNRDPDISPYRPVSRLFRNPLYVDVTVVPEWNDYYAALAPEARRAVSERLAALRATVEVDYEGAWSLKREVLRGLHRVFVERHLRKDSERGRAFGAYVEAQGKALEDFATFMALADHYDRRGGDGRDFPTWSAAHQRADSAEVAAFRGAQADEVDFQRFVQFETDRQLREVAVAACGADLPIGLYTDLAIGSSPCGADAWSRPGLFVTKVRLGCPPDYYAPQGQEWGLPPMAPHRLRAEGYDYWIRMLQANLAHAGALRVDHVIGLKRQFWIPAGGKPQDGAYVRQPVSDLLGIAALESHRHGALVIGEDLGTVPEGFAPLLKRWGVLSCQVLYFQRGPNGEFLSADRYSDRALVTSTTHDHVSVAGFAAAADVKLRRRVGTIVTEAEYQQQLAGRRRDVELLNHRLLAEGAAAPPGAATFAADWALPQRNGHDPAGLCVAVHRFLSRTPAPLMGIMLDDLAGEMEPVNVPGVGPDKHRSWARKMAKPLESLAEDVAAVLDAVRPGRNFGGEAVPLKGA